MVKAEVNAKAVIFVLEEFYTFRSCFAVLERTFHPARIACPKCASVSADRNGLKSLPYAFWDYKKRSPI